jgi:hypothetical protein
MADDVNQSSPPIEVRNSAVHGRGVFASRGIAKGERIIEYLGDRVSHAEADRRYESKDANDSHTFLFIVDRKTVIDAGVDGNDARFFNQSCDPNCESTVEKGRVYIDALREIQPGEELTYDYQIYREAGDPDNIDEVFACRCGSPKCRGTMLWPMEPKKKKRKKKGAGTQAKKKGVVAKKSGKGKTGAVGKSAAGRSKGGKPNGAGKSKGKSKGKQAVAKGSARGKSAAGKSTARKKVAKKKSGRR